MINVQQYKLSWKNVKIKISVKCIFGTYLLTIPFLFSKYLVIRHFICQNKDRSSFNIGTVQYLVCHFIVFKHALTEVPRED